MAGKLTHEELERRVAALEKQIEQYQITEFQYPPETLSVLMEAFRYIPLCKTFEEAAKHIFNHCKRLTGARSGYVALLSENGEENEVLYLDAGGLPCDVDPTLPMPIRGLREIAYKTKEVAYDNAFTESPWLEYMPDGHVKLENVLFTPINIDDKTVGVIGIANKLGGFDKKDVETAKLLGDLASVALIYAISQDSLRESEEKYRILFENTGEGLFVAQDDKIVFQNPRTFELTGYSAEEFQSKSFVDFIHEDDREMVMDRHIRRLRGEKLPEHYIFRIIHKNGSILWSELNAVLIQWNGKPATLNFMSDITERKQSEEELRESENQISSIFRSAPVGIGSVVNRVLFKVNDCMCEMTGYDETELIGQSARMLYPSDNDFEFVGREKYAQIDDHGTGVVETRWQKKDGTIMDVLLSSTPVNLKDHSKGVTFTALDITERKQAEDALKSNYALLQIAGETAKFGGWSVDLENNICTWSNAVADIHDVPHGYAPPVQEAIKFYAPEWRGKITQIFSACAEEGLSYDEEMEIITQKGKRVWVRATGKAVKNEKEKIIKVQGSFQDITERKRVEEALKKSEERLTLALDSVSDAVWDWRVDTGEVYFSSRWYTMLGYEPYELPQEFETWRKLLHPDDLPGSETKISQHLEIAEPFEIEFRMRTKDDQWRWILARGKTVEQDEQGKAVRMLGTHMDITERKQAEETEKKFKNNLEKRNHFIQTILDNLPIGLAVNYIEEGTATYMNKKFEEIYGWPKQELENIGEFFHKIYPDPEYREKLMKQILEDIKSEDPEKMFWEGIEITRKDGKKRIISAKNIALYEQNLMISTVQDITEKKTLQSQLNQAQKMESVGRLAGGVAHDFNNMLGVILGHTELALERAKENHDLYNDLNEIQKAAQRSANLTKQLLTFARKDIVSPKQIDLNDIVESMLNMLHRLIGEDIDLVWKPTGNLWPVKMDPSQVDQILANLCVNARDAIADVGKLTIETGMKTFDAEYCTDHAGFIPGDFVLLAFSDNGCGMDKDTLDKLFEPFFTTKDVGKGTGLGLATIYGIVKQNNGFINVYSEPGQGTTFRIYLPRCSAGDETPGVIQPEKPVPTGNETILIVEDEPAILKLTRMMLERKGYSVLSAATPAEAIEMVENYTNKIHLLMTDVVMPGMNGRDLARHLTPLYPDIKLLFMSGYTANVIAHQGVLDEGVAFIQKPFSMKDLSVKVREVLDKE
jgi:PAS domain S-box-containing protein